MARIPLTSGFTIIPEGKHIFRVYDVSYDETFGKLIVKLVNAKGQTIQERFSLKNANGEANEGALNAFSFFAKNCINDFSRTDIDPEELLNCYVEAEVVHTVQPNRNDPTKTVTFANLGDKSPASGFVETPCEKALTLGRENATPAPAPATAPATKSGLDLDSLLS